MVTVPVVSIDRVTPRSDLVSIDVGGTPFSFVAGQAVMAGVHGEDYRRPYSIACSPEALRDTGRIELLIGREPGAADASSLSRMASGTLVDVEGPMGTFTFPAEPELGRILFVAGGAGIAPLRSMLDHVLRWDPAPAVSLLYSARRSDEFAFIQEFREHARHGRVELRQTVTREASAEWGGGRGRFRRADFEAVVARPEETWCFVCGPPILVSESVTTLATVGVPEALIRTEQW